MSRIGKQPISIPDGVEIKIEGKQITCSGPKGALSLIVMDDVHMVHKDQQIILSPARQTKQARAFWGMQRSLIANMVQGVSQGWHKELEIRGVGFRAAMEGKNLKLNLGFSHDILYPTPEGMEIQCERPTLIKISGIDKQKIGQVAAEIRAMRRPDPYKGKGVRYMGEYVPQKEGKKK